MSTSWEKYLDEQDAIAEQEDIRQWPDARKLHHLSALYARYQSACARWEEAELAENHAFDLAQLRGMDRRTKEFKDYRKAGYARQQCGYIVQDTRTNIVDFIGVIYNPPDKGS